MNSQPPTIIVPHGGYRSLICYRKSDVIYQGTVEFCKRFLPATGDRTVDQMVQAARSCKQNIVEGSSTSGTSRECELRLTSVARASLDELLEDYRDYLKCHSLVEWGPGFPRRVNLRKFASLHNDWVDWAPIFSAQDAEALANAQITLISQTQYLLDQLLKNQESELTLQGDIRERMRAVRQAAKTAKWDDGIFAYLAQSKSMQELSQRTSEAHWKIDDIARRLSQGLGE